MVSPIGFPIVGFPKHMVSPGARRAGAEDYLTFPGKYVTILPCFSRSPTDPQKKRHRLSRNGVQSRVTITEKEGPQNSAHSSSSSTGAGVGAGAGRETVTAGAGAERAGAVGAGADAPPKSSHSSAGADVPVGRAA